MHMVGVIRIFVLCITISWEPLQEIHCIQIYRTSCLSCLTNAEMWDTQHVTHQTVFAVLNKQRARHIAGTDSNMSGTIGGP